MFVFTGILPICANDDGLAAVLGHEIAHNVAHHSAEKLSTVWFLQIGCWALELLGIAPASLSQALADLAFMKPGSRKQESEADYIGLMIMAGSCYDPEGAAELEVLPESLPEKHANGTQLETNGGCTTICAATIS